MGLFVVQLAHNHGAHVIATASAATLPFVQSLGADDVLDYRGTDFQSSVRDIDIVFDTVGGDTRQRSLSVLKPEGKLISIAADGDVATDPVVRAACFIVEPRQAQLVKVARLLDARSLRTLVKAALPLEDAPSAYAGNANVNLSYGKLVLLVRAQS